jgi:hypothetical protein
MIRDLGLIEEMCILACVVGISPGFFRLKLGQVLVNLCSIETDRRSDSCDGNFRLVRHDAPREQIRM